MLIRSYVDGADAAVRTRKHGVACIDSAYGDCTIAHLRYVLQGVAPLSVSVWALYALPPRVRAIQLVACDCEKVQGSETPVHWLCERGDVLRFCVA